jgi:hypothetical protein
MMLSVGLISSRSGRSHSQREIWEREHEMIGGSLRTMEAFRDQRFPEIRQGEQRNPTIPSSIGRQHSGAYGRRG